MRLLLDEHFDYAIAEELRRRGVDVIAIKGERPDLEGRDDDEVLRIATAERRVVVTNNVRDAPLVESFALRGQTQFGVLFTDDETFPRSADRIGQLVLALAAFTTGKPEDWLLDGCMYLG